MCTGALHPSFVSEHLIQGISDTPAWVVTKANTYARLMGKTPFVIYQGAWSILQRDFERDIIPMARSEGAFYRRNFSGTLHRVFP